MASQQQQTFGWRAKVRDWLWVVEQERRMFGNDIRTVAQRHGATFPKSLLIQLLRPVIKDLAVWIVKSALKQAAADLGLSIDDTTVGLLADLVVTLA